jgi:hypothetical protein
MDTVTDRSSFPTTQLLPARAAGIGDILDAGFLLFRRSLPTCLPWSLLAVLLGQLPSVYLLGSGQALALSAPKDLLWWMLMGLAACGTLWCWLAIMLRQRATLLRSSLGADLRAALQLLPAALGALALGLVAVAIGLVLLVIPGIYLLVAFWPVLAIVVFEARGPRAALDQALQLARGAWRHLAGTLVIVVISVLGLYVVGSLCGLLFAQLAGGAAAARNPLVAGLVAGVLGAAFQPLLIALGLAAYADLRHRRDQASDSASSSA